MKKSIYIGVAFVSISVVSSCQESETAVAAPANESIKISDTTGMLPSWEHTPRERIFNWLDAVSKEGSADFIPVADRIAVFDNDGTLWPEQPYPNQLQYAFDYIKAHWDEHPEWKGNAELKAAANGDLKTLTADGQKGLMTVINAVHGNISASDFTNSVATWSDTATSTHFNKKYTEVIYQPMIELLEVLRKNGFKTFIVSGGGADFMRAFAEETYGIPPYQIVGSYGDVEYELKDGKPEITKIDGHIFIDDSEGKPEAIHRFIGKTPVLCGGNSYGDQAMMQYTSSSPYQSLCLIVRHTDADREFAYETKTISGHLETALSEAVEKDWMVVDMKKDWKNVFAFEKH